MKQPEGMRYVRPESLTRPIGYNHGVVLPATGNVLFLSGQTGADREGRIQSSRFVDQFDAALANLLTVVAEAGGNPESIGKLTLFVTDKAAYEADRRAMGEVYRARMGQHYPAMTLVEVKSLLDPRAPVEIEGIAIVPS